MWAQLGAQFNLILAPIMAGVAGALAAALVPLLLAALTLWIIVETAGVMTGSSSTSWPSLVWRASIIVAVSTLATSVAFTTGPLFDAWDGIRGQIASAYATASGGVVNAASPWGAIDALAVAVESALAEIRTEMGRHTGITEIPLYILYFGIWLVLAISGGLLQLVCGWLVMLSSLLGAFAIGLAPLFLSAAAYPAARQYFVNWLTFLLSVAVMSGVAMFCLAVSIRISDWSFTTIAGLGGMMANTADVAGVVLKLAAVQVLLAVLVFQGPSIAGQMLGAAGIGQGGSLIQTALLLSRVSRGGGAKAGNGPSPAGQITAGSAAYTSGRAAGAAARHVYQQVASRMSARASTPRT